MTRQIMLCCHQERTPKVLASLLSNQIKRYYVKDPKKITSKDIPQKPEDCGCSRLPKSSKRKEKEKPSKKSEMGDTAKHGKSRSKAEEECHQPPSPEACKKGTKQKETEEPRDECACEPCEGQEVEADSTPKQIDCVKPLKKSYQPDCSKLKQTHICNERAKGKHEESKKKTSQIASKSQAKLEDCCQSKKTSPKSAPKIKTKAEECSGSKSTALYCAKRLTERKAGEIQSCADATPVSDKPKTIECALGKKSKESKPVCKHKQKEKETCSSTKSKEASTKSTCKSQVTLQKQNVRTINPCDTSAKPKGCTARRAETYDQKKNGNLLKILGIPAVILAILGLLYQYAPPPSPPPDIPIS